MYDRNRGLERAFILKFRTVLTGGKELKTKIIMGVAAVVSIMAMTGCSNSKYKYENVQ